MDIKAVNLHTIIKDTTEPWSPVDVAHVNDHVARVALLTGHYHWHKHEAEDELFYILKGSILIHLRDQPDITVKKGQLAVIPKGVEHRTQAKKPAYVLLFEPASTQIKGD